MQIYPVANAHHHSVLGVALVKRPYAQESHQQDPATLWSR